MTKRMIAVKPDKMKSFVQGISLSGFDLRDRVSYPARKRVLPVKFSIPHLKRIASSFILFDWEFFCNELEYE